MPWPTSPFKKKSKVRALPPSVVFELKKSGAISSSLPTPVEPQTHVSSKQKSKFKTKLDDWLSQLGLFIIGKNADLLEPSAGLRKHSKPKLITKKILAQMGGFLMAAGHAALMAIPCFLLFSLSFAAPVAIALAAICGAASFWVNYKLFSSSLTDLFLKSLFSAKVHDERTNEEVTQSITQPAYKAALIASLSLTGAAALGFAVIVFLAVTTLTGGVGGLVLASLVAGITFFAQAVLMQAAFRKFFAYAQLKRDNNSGGIPAVFKHFWNKFTHFYSFEDCRNVDNYGRKFEDKGFDPSTAVAAGYNKVAVTRKAISMFLTTLISAALISVAIIATLGLVAIFQNGLNTVLAKSNLAGNAAAAITVAVAMRLVAFAGRLPVVIDNIARIAVKLSDWLSLQCIRLGKGIHILFTDPVKAATIISTTLKAWGTSINAAFTKPSLKGFLHGLNKVIDVVALTINTIVNAIFGGTATERIHGDLETLHAHHPNFEPPSEEVVRTMLRLGNAFNSAAICGNAILFSNEDPVTKHPVHHKHGYTSLPEEEPENGGDKEPNKNNVFATGLTFYQKDSQNKASQASSIEPLATLNPAASGANL